ncbi:inositol phosphatase [Babesia ovis]|uniref:Inositol phosphatase n=1 Tax=Babesia ovis TaxID=5869 RepID=A0A9W5WVH9_BABOV|nr:inositol phosphatase [Babesia ovis]
MYILLPFLLVCFRFASGSILLFGPQCPNTLACASDHYLIGGEPKVPDEGLEKVKDYPQMTIEPLIETAFYTGFTNQLSECIMRLRTEYRNLNENLVYPRVLYYLSLAIAKDYVRCHTLLVDLQMMKMLHFSQRLLMGYANSNFTLTKATDPKVIKEKYCVGMTYIDMADKLANYRRKRISNLEAEVKRIVWNVDNVPSVKATGKLSLLIDGFFGASPFMAFCLPTLIVIHYVL